MQIKGIDNLSQDSRFVIGEVYKHYTRHVDDAPYIGVWASGKGVGSNYSVELNAIKDWVECNKHLFKRISFKPFKCVTHSGHVLIRMTGRYGSEAGMAYHRIIKLVARPHDA